LENLEKILWAVYENGYWRIKMDEKNYNKFVRLNGAE
jgi:hypothetical protein